MPVSAAASAREILVRLHDVMASRAPAQAKLNQVVQIIGESIGSEVCSIYLLREGVLELFATRGLAEEAVHVTKLALGEGLVGTIAEDVEVLNLDEAASHPDFAYKPETGEDRFHSFAGVPISLKSTGFFSATSFGTGSFAVGTGIGAFTAVGIGSFTGTGTGGFTATGTGSYLHNPVTEIALAESAHLTHIRIVGEGDDAYHLAALHADIATGATYDSFTLVVGGKLTRTEIHARLLGPNATAHLNAAQLLDGTQHADFTSVVRHAAPNCSPLPMHAAKWCRLIASMSICVPVNCS